MSSYQRFYYATALCTTPKACPKGLSGRAMLAASMNRLAGPHSLDGLAVITSCQ